MTEQIHGNTRSALARFIPQMSTAERDARFATLRAQRYTVTAIAEMEGVSKGTVSKGIRRALNATRAEGGRELQQAKFLELEAAAEMAWEIARNPTWKTSNTGAIIRDPVTKEPLIDQSTVLSALDTVRKCVGDQRALMGLDEPKKSIQAHLDVNQLDRDLQANAERLRAASGGVPGREITDVVIIDEGDPSGG